MPAFMMVRLCCVSLYDSEVLLCQPLWWRDSAVSAFMMVRLCCVSLYDGEVLLCQPL